MPFEISIAQPNEIVVSFGCGGDHRAEIVRVTPELIEIEARYKRPRSEPGDCLGGVRLILDEPVGDRIIIDHSTGEPVFDPFADTG